MAELHPVRPSRLAAGLTRLADWAVRTRRRLWLCSFAVFLALAGAWAAATPLAASPDEHAHFIRAAAVARGQFGGPEVMVEHTVAGVDSEFAETGVRLPGWYAQLPHEHECYSWQPAVPASCAPKIGSGGPTVQVTTAAGRYHPAYYLYAGLPSLVTDGPTALYLMRLLSAVLCAALLASAMVTAAEWRSRRPAMTGLLVAATPTALFLAGMVNPSGGEIAAGILVWSAMLAMLRSPDPLLLNRRLARLGIGGLVLINIRPLGLLWFAGAAVVGLLVHRRGALRPLLRRKALWGWTVLLGTASVGALLWSRSHPDHSVITLPPWYNSPAVAAKDAFGNSMDYIHQMIGWFGWLDTKPTVLTWVVWTAAIGLLAVLTVVLGRRRDALSAVLVALGIVLAPPLAQAAQYHLGPVWQGRYLMPFAVGLPLLCGAVLADRTASGGPALPWRRLTATVVLPLALANLAAFYWTLRRFGVGTSGSLFNRHAHWLPPGGWVVWTALYALAALLLVVPAFASDHAGTPSAGRRAGRRHRLRADGPPLAAVD
ncbi:DUF2142 domain-containing protein [Kitasatospora sp. NPDC090308]|uniref:DUF2142 domain-containing protein n=1 Tax=Kitasatospora sp. NPDC090308 TaxID=3364082 RepID=UPI003814A116